MNAIPTTYKGITFRSRLEAKWAYVFDHLGWSWDYEPIDLNGYIPDFILNFYKPILVEIKPVVEFGEFQQYTTKIIKSGWKNEAAIFGAKLFKSRDWSNAIDLGVLTEVNQFDAYWYEPCVFERCRKCGKYSFIHTTGGWTCRVNGCGDGDHYLDMDANYSNFLTEIWNKSTNYFQYKPWSKNGTTSYIDWKRNTLSS